MVQFLQIMIFSEKRIEKLAKNFVPVSLVVSNNIKSILIAQLQLILQVFLCCV